MSREVSVTIAFDHASISTRWGIGAQQGGEVCWEAPVREPGARALWDTEEGHALILEALAVTHFPHVDTLVLALPAGEADAHRQRLEQAYTGVHEVRNTECRSQRLRVRVRRVRVVADPPAPDGVD